MAKYVDEHTKLIDNMIESLRLTVSDSTILDDADVRYIEKKLSVLKLQKTMYVKLMRKDIKSSIEKKPSTFMANMKKTLDILNSI